MSSKLISAAALAILLAAGCHKNSQSTTAASSGYGATNSVAAAPSSMTPEELGTLGAQIKKQPNDAVKLLSQHGLNEQSFAAAIRKVSEDPGAAKRYTAAYKNAS
jgi:hypothetical protein